MNKFAEKTIAINEQFTGNIISLEVQDVLLPDGNKAKREIVRHPGAVAIIPVTDNGTILFVNQYRKPLDRSIIEIPAGRIEPNEKPEVTAVRELEEEIGYTTNDLSYVTSFYTSPGFANEMIHLYYTSQLEKLSKPVQGDEDEFIEIVELTLEEAEKYEQDERIIDAKTNYALLYLKFKRMIK